NNLKLPMAEEDLGTGSARILDKQREIKYMAAVLRKHKEEFEAKAKSLEERRDELKKKGEKLQESLLNFNKHPKDNDAKRARALKKAEAFAALLTKKDKLQEQVSQNRIYWSFLDSVLKSSEKFEDIGKLIGRFETLVRTREQLLKRQSTLESVQATDAKKTLLLGRIHVATRNLYHMTGGVSSGAAGFNVKDTLDELDRIRQYIQKWTDIVQELGSDKGSIKASDHAQPVPTRRK
uniref:DUF4200 domain-containing protein n=1 Tax=Astyanax mexicanus TaxID=7994 RepID=A0A8B9L038_ASTMX